MPKNSNTEPLPTGELSPDGTPILKQMHLIKYFTAMLDPEGNEVCLSCNNCSDSSGRAEYQWARVKKISIGGGAYLIKCPVCDCVIRPLVSLEESALVFHDPYAMTIFRQKYPEGLANPKATKANLLPNIQLPKQEELTSVVLKPLPQG
jgi:hypothetical protein